MKISGPAGVAGGVGAVGVGMVGADRAGRGPASGSGDAGGRPEREACRQQRAGREDLAAAASGNAEHRAVVGHEFGDDLPAGAAGG